MTMARSLGWTLALVASLLIVPVAGCGRGNSYEVAEVDGVVLISGKPGHKISVEFIPNVTGEASPPMSSAQTDAEGRFTLQLVEPGGSTRPGAVVGSHRVVLRDIQLAESFTGRGVPIRLPIEYTMPASTPLTQEVKEGQQTIEIKVPPR